MHAVCLTGKRCQSGLSDGLQAAKTTCGADVHVHAATPHATAVTAVTAQVVRTASQRAPVMPGPLVVQTAPVMAVPASSWNGTAAPPAVLPLATSVPAMTDGCGASIAPTVSIDPTASFHCEAKGIHAALFCDGPLLLGARARDQLLQACHRVHDNEMAFNKRINDGRKVDIGWRSSGQVYSSPKVEWILVLQADQGSAAAYTRATFTDVSQLASSISSFGRWPIPERRVEGEEFLKLNSHMADFLCQWSAHVYAAHEKVDPLDAKEAMRAVSKVSYLQGGATVKTFCGSVVPGAIGMSGVSINWEFAPVAKLKPCSYLERPKTTKRGRYIPTKVSEMPAYWCDDWAPSNSECTVEWHHDSFDDGMGALAWWTFDPNSILYGGDFACYIKDNFVHMKPCYQAFLATFKTIHHGAAKAFTVSNDDPLSLSTILPGILAARGSLVGRMPLPTPLPTPPLLLAPS